MQVKLEGGRGIRATDPIESAEPREPIESSDLSDRSDHFELPDGGFIGFLMALATEASAP